MKKKPSLYQVRIDEPRREKIEALKERLGTPGSLPSFVLWLIDRGVESVKEPAPCPPR